MRGYCGTGTSSDAHSIQEAWSFLRAPGTCDARAAAGGRSLAAAADAPLSHGGAVDGARSFDFLHGQWIVENRRLKKPFSAAPGAGPAARQRESEGWAVFDAVYSCRPLLAGAGHIDEMAAEDPTAWAMLSLFDARERTWRIHRALPAEGVLRPPLKGRFEDGVGIFTGEDWCNGTRMLVRHIWTPTPHRPRWEQAFSTDDGASWRTDWTMEFGRVDWPQ